MKENFWDRLVVKTGRFVETGKKIFYYGWVPFMLFHAYKSMRQPSVIALLAGGAK
ncbi:hypothetical protein PPL_09049 [Heterostelium album PN500]|uniref:Uncharacterized protein n=1 Tax=Heterostelium pallidum (strain ATCC 26659 / Pp 5 / PN500) TaxID=670386 RepID=D3BKG8_HETP5|nr:hypothetical protein PPL_09049 [Heterostelium album PN500]EFA78398.1 hypothetical protein PPL_09049 [Heterostelium album PN500]|eukprot:XP_020430523.1 hypothetical protein PPL_09049 [Heterostelium album PN500]